MNSLFFWSAIGFLGGTVFSSLFEWTLHRFVMHKPVRWFEYPFKTHALVHHHIFKADHRYHLVDEADKHTIPMAWWNGPVIIFLCVLPFALISFFTGTWGVAIGAALAVVSYYAAYEYMHWCMHLPKKRGLERSGVFFRLNGHHILHHRYMHKNFNVVLPLADFMFGTLLLRSRIPFTQPEGPAVPDLQPLPEPMSMWRRALRFVGLCFTGVR